MGYVLLILGCILIDIAMGNFSLGMLIAAPFIPFALLVFLAIYVEAVERKKKRLIEDGRKRLTEYRRRTSS